MPKSGWIIVALSLLLWGFAVFVDVSGGYNPGFVSRDIPYPYPTMEVVLVAVVVTVVFFR